VNKNALAALSTGKFIEKTIETATARTTNATTCLSKAILEASKNKSPRKKPKTERLLLGKPRNRTAFFLAKQLPSNLTARDDIVFFATKRLTVV
jgi:hypothetical protein